jgi:hypothetical protein
VRIACHPYGDDSSSDLLARLAALKTPGDIYEHRNELLPDEDFDLIYDQ